MTEQETHRVAVTVFASAPGVDEIDAGHIAVAAIRHVLRAARDPERDDLVISAPLRTGPVPIRIHRVMETGTAARNGYLWVRTTGQAYREAQ